jgi:hypothetical protein
MGPAALALIAEVIEALISGAEQLPSIVTAAETAIGLLQSNTDPTPAQEASIRAALDQSHAALQASGAASTVSGGK